MSAKFKNTCTYTIENWIAASKTIFSQGLFLKLVVVVAGLGLGLFGIIDKGVTLGIDNARMVSLFSSLLLGAALFYAVYTIFFPNMVGKKAFRKTLESFGMIMEITTTFDDECFYEQNNLNDEKLRRDYDLVARITQTPKVFIINLPGKIFVMLDKARFTTGTPEQFANFIKQKCPAAKVNF